MCPAIWIIYYLGEWDLSAAEKAEKAYIFQDSCDMKSLKETVFSSDVCAESGYADSWKLLKKKNNSIKRKTNINLVLRLFMKSTFSANKLFPNEPN